MTQAETATPANSGPRPRMWAGILGVTIALTPPLVQVALGPVLKETFTFPVDRAVSLLVFWVAIAIVLGLAHFVEGYPLARFGLTRDKEKSLRTRLIEWILALLASLVMGFVIIMMSTKVRVALTGEPAEPPDLTNWPFWILLAAWATASFGEEMLYRAYSIERLIDLMGNKWLAGLLTALAFSLMHLFAWDLIHVLTVVFPASVMFTLVYLWRRNFAFVVIAHAILNAPLLLLPIVAPYL